MLLYKGFETGGCTVTPRVDDLATYIRLMGRAEDTQQFSSTMAMTLAAVR